MEEKILVKSEHYDVKKLFKLLIIIGFILSSIMFLTCIFDTMSIYDTYLEHQKNGACGWPYDDWEECYCCDGVADDLNKFEYALAHTYSTDDSGTDYAITFAPVIILSLLGALIFYGLRSYELVVTDKRIFGKILWGKRVDLPVDSVSATATIGFLKGISISTSSGKISFLLIKNTEDVYKAINGLIINRQEKPTSSTVVHHEQSNADELKKYKELLDNGIITQEEFDAKKKQLLGL